MVHYLVHEVLHQLVEMYNFEILESVLHGYTLEKLHLEIYYVVLIAVKLSKINIAPGGLVEVAKSRFIFRVYIWHGREVG